MADILDILISRYRFLSTPEKLLLKDIAGDYNVLKNMSLNDIERITGRKHKLRDFSLKKMLKEAENAWNILAAGRIKCLFFEQPEYPAQLAEIYNPPYMLYYQGSMPDWDTPPVAVVGTRLATGHGLDAAFRLGFDLAECGITVVSGLAMGIDSSAHTGAAAASGKTVAVLGCGPDRIYPAVNKPVAASVLESNGTVLSEYLPGEPPRQHHFPERNRIISGLSRGVVVVEAPRKSGALITADFALEQGRDLFIHQAGIKSSVNNGDRSRLERLVFDGAPVISGAEEILSEWGMEINKNHFSSLEMEVIMKSETAGLYLAEKMKEELAGYRIKFNGNYFRRAHVL